MNSNYKVHVAMSNICFNVSEPYWRYPGSCNRGCNRAGTLLRSDRNRHVHDAPSSPGWGEGKLTWRPFHQYEWRPPDRHSSDSNQRKHRDPRIEDRLDPILKFNAYSNSKQREIHFIVSLDPDKTIFSNQTRPDQNNWISIIRTDPRV